MNKNNYTFGRKRKNIQVRANLPIVITIVGVIALIYGVIRLVISQIKPETTPISTITVTKNTPSASELNLNAALVDYHPSKKKDKDQEDKDEEEEKDETENSESPSVEVLGAQARSEALLKVIAPMFGVAAANSNQKEETSEELDIEDDLLEEDEQDEQIDKEEKVDTPSGF